MLFLFCFFFCGTPDRNRISPHSTPGAGVRPGDLHRVADRDISLIPERDNWAPITPTSPHNPYLFPNFLLNHSSHKQTLKNTQHFRQKSKHTADASGTCARTVKKPIQDKCRTNPPPQHAFPLT